MSPSLCTTKRAIIQVWWVVGKCPVLSAIYRSQWLGVDGAPQVQALTFNLPLSNQRIGLGLNLQRFTIGITEQITADLQYAYRFRLGRGYLGIGLQGSIRSLSVDFTDPRLVATQPLEIDGAIPAMRAQRFLFNFGAGLYYQGQNFYLGASAPRLLSNNIDFGEDEVVISREIQHFYFMAGGSFELSDIFVLRPQMLFRYALNSPIDADFNLSLVMDEKFITGVSYRLGGSTVEGWGESIDILLAAQISPQFLLGVSYDITLSELKDFNTGSVELLVRLFFGASEGNDFVNPRFF
jgi:type IX secretion system PorP/SprF family membrane protein